MLGAIIVISTISLWSYDYFSKDAGVIGDISLSISLDKNKYHLGEPINMVVTLKNEKREDVWINDLDFNNDTIHFNIRSPDGKNLNRSMPVCQGIAKALLLNRGESISCVFKLTNLYDFPNVTGKYSVVAIYVSGGYSLKPGSSSEFVETWHGIVQSDKLFFYMEEKL